MRLLRKIGIPGAKRSTLFAALLALAGCCTLTQSSSVTYAKMELHGVPLNQNQLDLIQQSLRRNGFNKDAAIYKLQRYTNGLAVGDPLGTMADAIIGPDLIDCLKQNKINGWAIRVGVTQPLLDPRKRWGKGCHTNCPNQAADRVVEDVVEILAGYNPNPQ